MIARVDEGLVARTRAAARVLAIDPHEGVLSDPPVNTRADLSRNLERAGLADLVTPIVARSEDAADSVTEPLQALFVDGDHSAAAVRRDLEQWLPKVEAGGILALHDVVNPAFVGPRQALGRVLWRSRELGRVRFVDSIAYARKLERNRFSDRLCNRAAALFLAAYSLRPSRAPAPVLALLRWIIRLTPLKRGGTTA